MFTRQFQAFSSYMASLIAPLQCHILYILPEFLVQISNLAKTHHQGLIDKFNHLCPSRSSNHNRNFISRPFNQMCFVVIKKSRLGNRMFFSKKGVAHRNVQEFSKLTLFLNFDFFCFKKYHFMLPTFLGRALLNYQMMP